MSFLRDDCLFFCSFKSKPDLGCNQSMVGFAEFGALIGAIIPHRRQHLPSYGDLVEDLLSGTTCLQSLGCGSDST